MMSVDYSWLPFAWHLHMFFVFATFLGVVLFLIWAFKHLDKKTLKNWWIWLLVVGLLGLFLTATWGFEGIRYMHGNDYGWFKTMMSQDLDDFESAEEFREYMLDRMEDRGGFRFDDKSVDLDS